MCDVCRKPVKPVFWSTNTVRHICTRFECYFYTLLSEIEYIYSCMNKKSHKNNKFKRRKIRYLINLFLQQFNFIVKFINIVEECKVFIFHFNEFSYQPIDVIYTCGFFYGLKSFLVRLKNRDKKRQITWCINKPVQSFPK